MHTSICIARKSSCTHNGFCAELLVRLYFMNFPTLCKGQCSWPSISLCWNIKPSMHPSESHAAWLGSHGRWQSICAAWHPVGCMWMRASSVPWQRSGFPPCTKQRIEKKIIVYKFEWVCEKREVDFPPGDTVWKQQFCNLAACWWSSNIISYKVMKFKMSH